MLQVFSYSISRSLLFIYNCFTFRSTIHLKWVFVKDKKGVKIFFVCATWTSSRFNTIYWKDRPLPTVSQCQFCCIVLRETSDIWHFQNPNHLKFFSWFSLNCLKHRPCFLFISSHLVQCSIHIVGKSREFTSHGKVFINGMAAIGVYVTAGEGKGGGFALLGGSNVCVFLRQSLPSCTFAINFFTLTIIGVWIIVLTGLKTSIRGIIHWKQFFSCTHWWVLRVFNKPTCSP